MKKIDKHYVSEIDRKLAEFDETHRLSGSQVAEIEKYERVFAKRDGMVGDTLEEKLWE